MSWRVFYEPRSWYIANQSGSAKEIVNPKIGENIEMLVCFICMGHKTWFWLLSIIIIKSQWINIKIKQKIEDKYIQSYIFPVSAAYLFKSFCHISFFRQKDCKKKVSTCRQLVTIFYLTWPVDRKRTTF